MYDQLFHYPPVLARHRNAPMLIEREEFLQHCASQGMARTTLKSMATDLSVVAQRLAMPVDGWTYWASANFAQRAPVVLYGRTRVARAARDRVEPPS